VALMAISVPVRIQMIVSVVGSVDAVYTDEILLSSDKTIAVIDGSGVLADPAGINREELVRLAKLRVPVEKFDKSKLSKDGYLVRVEEQDVKLPCMSFLNRWALLIVTFRSG
jgi:NAD-specific glutamate dehydrogenase